MLSSFLTQVAAQTNYQECHVCLTTKLINECQRECGSEVISARLTLAADSQQKQLFCLQPGDNLVFNISREHYPFYLPESPYSSLKHGFN